DISSDITSALAPMPELDMEKEWKAFRPRIWKWRSSSRWFMKVAAIFLGVMVIGGITGKLVDYFMTTDNQPLVAIVKQPEPPMKETDPKHDAEASEKGSAEVIIENNESLPGVTHRKRVKTESIESETVKEENIIDIDEILRIEQAKIDNEMAILAAQQIEAEYNSILLNYDLSEIDNQQLTYTVNMLTMQ
ncbi:MAG: hypothetical protein K2G13_02260, partial [Muribaculaceae bacterium]|nr:hypothetical protein [Muribaculaceae bacterium]